jgi:cap1 methyltransferase
MIPDSNEYKCSGSKDLIASLKDKVFKIETSKVHSLRIYTDPFESIGRGIFMTRSGLKMANLDYLSGFKFSEAVGQQELLYFAEIHGGPGGFSEYILHKRGFHSKGYGFTPINENVYDLKAFVAGPSQTFHPYYGVKKDGDIYDTENIKAFGNLVKNDCNKVHVACADGGFSVFGRENEQEVLARQLYLVQCAMGLSVLRTGGHFLIKFFDVYTQFSKSLIYLMSKCFQFISIVKPYMSRPSNSERYLICFYKECDDLVTPILEYMLKVNDAINDTAKQLGVYSPLKPAPEEATPSSLFKKEKIEERFVTFYNQSMDHIATNQIETLIKFTERITGDECRLSKKRMVKRFLIKWNVDVKLKNASDRDKFDKFCQKNIISVKDEIVKRFGKEFLKYGHFYKSLGKTNRSRTYVYNDSGEWIQVLDCGIAPYTLFFGNVDKTGLKILYPVILGGKKIIDGKMIDIFVEAHRLKKDYNNGI